MAEADTAAPTTELGQATTSLTNFPTGSLGRSAPAKLPSWDVLMDDLEHVPELQGHRAFQAYDRMMTDAQVAAVMASIMLPLMRYDWVLRPQKGVTDDALERIAQDTGLAIEGEERQEGVDGGRFTFHEHLRAALRCLRYGVMPFEQVGEIDAQGWFRYRKLAERPPRTLEALNVARDGGLVSITQQGGTNGIEIPVSRLVVYSWEREGAAWQGRSMLRPMFKPWMLKDRLLRVDAMKHERNGMGLPTAWAPPNATDEVMLALQEITSAMKAGEEAGMALPPGSDIRLLGVQGSLPDTIASVRYHDEQISKAGLALFMDLATSASGNRALSSTFEGMFGVAIDYVAQFIAATFTQHAIRDWFGWNLGADAAFPLLVAQRPADPELVVGDFRSLVDAGAITLDRETESWVRRRMGVPPKPPEEPTLEQSFAYDLDNGVVTIDDRRAQLKLEPRADGLGALTAPEFLAMVANMSMQDEGAGAVIADAVKGTGAANTGGVPSADAVTQAGRRAQAVRFSASLTSRAVHAAAPGAKRATEYDPKRYPDFIRRQPFQHEVAAATDFSTLFDTWDDARGKLVKAWASVRQEQDAALLKGIMDADGDLLKLAQLQAPSVGGDLVDAAMLDMADQGARLMAAEAKRQGATLPTVDRADLEELLGKRGQAVAQVMADDLASAAKREALRLTETGGLTAEQVAAEVAKHLDSLTDAYLENQLGGALTIAQNQGRFAAAEQATQATRWYASELLDGNTCSDCAGIDGKEYASAAEARQDYPAGGFKGCQGKDRCRGTIVVVYDEAAPTVQDTGEEDVA